MSYVYHTKRRQLTPEELTLARRELVEALIEEDKIAVEKALADKEFKRRMSPFQKTAKELMTKVRSGVDEGTAHCRVVVDTVTRTVKFFVEKKTWDNDTQTQYVEATLFDEQSFDEVGERQLTLWQDATAADAIDEAIDRFYDNEVFSVIDDALQAVYANTDSDPFTEDLLKCLMSPWPSDAAALWMKHAESPSTNINLAFMHRPIEEALTMFSAGVALLADANVLDEFDRSLFADEVDENIYDIASISLSIANTLPLFEAKAEAGDAEPVEAESEQNQH